MVDSERLAGEAAAEDRPNLLATGVAILWSFRLRGPRPRGSGTVDHAPYGALLDLTRREGLGALAERRDRLHAYLDGLAEVDPDALGRDEALAYWLNLYNAGAQRFALDTFERRLSSVLRIGRPFERPFVTVAGERMSLHDVENGKVRRFGDPRIHAALNCASRSCPPLPPEPFVGADLDARLDERMRLFLARGGLRADRERGRVALSKVFEWFGSDFARPARMPLILPAPPRTVLGALAPWIDVETGAWIEAADPEVTFQRYDWRLGSEVG